MLAWGKVAGQVNYADVFLEPNLLATYATDRLVSYVDSNSVVVQGQTVTVFQPAAGVDFTVPDEIGFGMVDVLGGVTGICSSIDGKRAARSVVPAYEGGRGRGELGSSYVTGANGLLSATPNYYGRGSEYESNGLNLRNGLSF